jgi:hypothetical protein
MVVTDQIPGRQPQSPSVTLCDAFAVAPDSRPDAMLSPIEFLTANPNPPL